MCRAAEIFHFECHYCHCGTLHCSAGATRPIRPCVNFNALGSASLQTHLILFTPPGWHLRGEKLCEAFCGCRGSCRPASQLDTGSAFCFLFPAARRVYHQSRAQQPDILPLALRHLMCLLKSDVGVSYSKNSMLYHQFSKLSCHFRVNLKFKAHVEICGFGMFLLLRGIKIQLKSSTCVTNYYTKGSR